MFPKYSPLSSEAEEADVDENDSEKEKHTWRQLQNVIAFGYSTNAVIGILVAITLAAGIVGFSIGALVFRSHAPPRQILDTAPQGMPPVPDQRNML